MRRLFLLCSSVILLATPAVAMHRLHGLPDFVALYAEELQAECNREGLGDLVAADDFGLASITSHEVNGDGVEDYFVYRCFFGCSGNPSFFLGRGSPCGWGELLVSGESKPRRIFVPGMINRVLSTKPLKVVVTRPRALRMIGNYCSEGFADHDPQYLYELREGRFQLVGNCGQVSCRAIAETPDSILPQLD